MASRGKVPDAWDDEWSAKADKSGSVSNEGGAKLSKAERRAKQAELNRRLWEEAEAPKTNFFVESRDKVPLQSEFKPTLKVLSRKPAPNMVAKKDAVTGLEKLTIEEDDDDEDEDAASKQKAMTMQERQARAAREREEKQKKYEEVRERLFGSSNPTSGSSTPGNTTPPPSSSSRGKGKGRSTRDSRPSSSSSAKHKLLYDPTYTAKPDSAFLQKHSGAGAEPPAPAEDDTVLRQPRGPDGSGRGGGGFSSRGRKN